jgi:hypothetical protein
VWISGSPKLERTSEFSLIGQIRYWVRECRQFYVREKEHESTKTSQLWQRPIADIIKINFDGAFCDSTRQGGWGFVARDSDGRVRGSGAGYIEHVGSALQAEAVACGEAMQAANDWGMGHVQFESDSLNLVNALNSSDRDLAPEGIIFRNIKSFLRPNFISVEVRFAPRSCNKVAHAMAALGADQLVPRQVWQDDVPSSVHTLVASVLAEPV